MAFNTPSSFNFDSDLSLNAKFILHRRISILEKLSIGMKNACFCSLDAFSIWQKIVVYWLSIAHAIVVSHSLNAYYMENRDCKDRLVELITELPDHKSIKNLYQYWQRERARREPVLTTSVCRVAILRYADAKKGSLCNILSVGKITRILSKCSKGCVYQIGLESKERQHVLRMSERYYE